MTVRITCINKAGGNHADPHHAIESLGWINEQSGESGKNSRLEVYDWIKNKGGKAYVVSGSNRVAVGVVNATPPYIRTFADGVYTDNLLALPECR